MGQLATAQVTELFHVAFLDVLSTRLEPGRYVLKGGANLRYFFNSVRYSEDIDLDLVNGTPWSLESKVDGVLKSGAMQALLRAAGLTVGTFTKPKQTDTTRRWKIAIEVAGRSEPVRTKVEFSSRNGDDRRRLEQVPGRIVEPYAMRPPTIQHYVGDAPTEQKVRALAGRNETQARDVFDLDLLLRNKPLPAGAMNAELLGKAADIAMGLPFDAFRDQVLPFLEPEVVALYETEAAWEQMQTFVAERLEDAR
jgi:hypothetical protein